MSFLNGLLAGVTVGMWLGCWLLDWMTRRGWTIYQVKPDKKSEN